MAEADGKRFASAAQGPNLARIASYARMCLRFVRPDRMLVGVAVALALLSGLFQLLLMFLLASLILALSGGTAATPVQLSSWAPSLTVHQLLLAAAISLACVIFVTFPLAHVQASITSRVVARTRRALARGYVEATCAHRTRLPEGYLQQLIGEYSQSLSGALQQFCALVTAAATLGVLVVVPLLIDPGAGALVIPVVGAGLLLMVPLTSMLRRDAVKRAAVQREMATFTAQLSRLADEIEAFDVGGRTTELLDHSITRAERFVRRIHFYEAVTPVLYQLSALALLLAAIAVALVFQPADRSDIALVALLTLRVLTYGRQVLHSLQQGSALSPFVETIDEELREITANRRSRGNIVAVGFDGLEITNLSFAYPGGEPILRDLTLRLEPGEAVAIVGPSGEGKSTLCALLMGMRAPTSGSIATGTTPIDTVDPGRWAKLAAYVPQDPQLMRGTISENICLFRRGFTQDEVENAARKAHIHEEILELPGGYDAVVGPAERGLSGGQRQRLVIARALLGNPKLLLLDEPSSALDARSEALIVETLAELKGGTTILCVTHRTAALAVCDKAFQLRNGLLAPLDPAGR